MDRDGDSVHIGYNVINILGVKLYIEVCNVLKRCVCITESLCYIKDINTTL